MGLFLSGSEEEGSFKSWLPLWTYAKESQSGARLVKGGLDLATGAYLQGGLFLYFPQHRDCVCLVHFVIQYADMGLSEEDRKSC